MFCMALPKLNPQLLTYSTYLNLFESMRNVAIVIAVEKKHKKAQTVRTKNAVLLSLALNRKSKFDPHLGKQ